MNYFIALSDGSVGPADGARLIAVPDPSVLEHGDSIDDLISHGHVYVRSEIGMQP